MPIRPTMYGTPHGVALNASDAAAALRNGGAPAQSAAANRAAIDAIKARNAAQAAAQASLRNPPASGPAPAAAPGPVPSQPGSAPAQTLRQRVTGAAGRGLRTLGSGAANLGKQLGVGYLAGQATAGAVESFKDLDNGKKAAFDQQVAGGPIDQYFDAQRSLANRVGGLPGRVGNNLIGVSQAVTNNGLRVMENVGNAITGGYAGDIGGAISGREKPDYSNVQGGSGSTEVPGGSGGSDVLGTFNGRQITRAQSDALSAKLPTATGPVAMDANGNYAASTGPRAAATGGQGDPIAGALRDILGGGRGRGGAIGAVIPADGRDPYDKMASEIRSTHGGKAQGSMLRKLMEVEEMRQRNALGQGELANRRDAIDAQAYADEQQIKLGAIGQLAEMQNAQTRAGSEQAKLRMQQLELMQNNAQAATKQLTEEAARLYKDDPAKQQEYIDGALRRMPGLIEGSVDGPGAALAGAQDRLLDLPRLRANELSGGLASNREFIPTGEEARTLDIGEGVRGSTTGNGPGLLRTLDSKLSSLLPFGSSGQYVRDSTGRVVDVDSLTQDQREALGITRSK